MAGGGAGRDGLAAGRDIAGAGPGETLRGTTGAAGREITGGGAVTVGVLGMTGALAGGFGIDTGGALAGGLIVDGAGVTGTAGFGAGKSTAAGAGR